jgi:hypothetical protein
VHTPSLPTRVEVPRTYYSATKTTGTLFEFRIRVWWSGITIDTHAHSAKLCVLTWNACVLLREMRVLWLLIGQQLPIQFLLSRREF